MTQTKPKLQTSGYTTFAGCCLSNLVIVQVVFWILQVDVSLVTKLELLHQRY